MKHYRLFQAWQSQNKEYTDFLTKLLAEVSERQKQKGIEIEIIRFPAQDQAGSPDVVNMVWKQIADCDLFVGDLTKIAASDSHAISNPNVMYEVGIADALLGEKRVILVCSKDTNVSKLAFDVNHKRISPLNKNNPNAVNALEEWIEAGIAECEIQNLQRNFILRPLYEDLYVVYNNFMRIVFYDDYDYSEGVLPPNLEKIKKRLKDALLSELSISIDYECVIKRLKREIKSLHASNNKRYLSDIIRIYETLDLYNWFVHSVEKPVAFLETDTKTELLLQSTKVFFLTKVDLADKMHNSVFFDKKYVYISGTPPLQNVFLEEMISDQIKDVCHFQEIVVEDGKLTGIKMMTYKLTVEALDYYSKCISGVLDAIYNFMDKMNYQPTNQSSDIRSNTIITWNK